MCTCCSGVVGGSCVCTSSRSWASSCPVAKRPVRMLTHGGQQLREQCIVDQARQDRHQVKLRKGQVKQVNQWHTCSICRIAGCSLWPVLGRLLTMRIKLLQPSTALTTAGMPGVRYQNQVITYCLGHHRHSDSAHGLAGAKLCSVDLVSLPACALHSKQGWLTAAEEPVSDSRSSSSIQLSCLLPLSGSARSSAGMGSCSPSLEKEQLPPVAQLVLSAFSNMLPGLRQALHQSCWEAAQ